MRIARIFGLVPVVAIALAKSSNSSGPQRIFVVSSSRPRMVLDVVPSDEFASPVTSVETSLGCAIVDLTRSNAIAPPIRSSPTKISTNISIVVSTIRSSFSERIEAYPGLHRTGQGIRIWRIDGAKRSSPPVRYRNRRQRHGSVPDRGNRRVRPSHRYCGYRVSGIGRRLRVSWPGVYLQCNNPRKRRSVCSIRFPTS